MKSNETLQHFHMHLEISHQGQPSKIQDCPKRKDLDQSNLSNPQQIAVVEEATDEGDKDLNIGESQRTVSQEAEYVERRRGQTNQDHSDRLKRQTSSYKDQDFVY